MKVYIVLENFNSGSWNSVCAFRKYQDAEDFVNRLMYKSSTRIISINIQNEPMIALA